MSLTAAEIRDLAEHSLSNQAPKDSHITDLFEAVRPPFKEAFAALHANCPPSRELSLAITNLEQSLMWGVKAIAVHQDAILADVAAQAAAAKEAAIVAARGRA